MDKFVNPGQIPLGYNVSDNNLPLNCETGYSGIVIRQQVFKFGVFNLL